MKRFSFLLVLFLVLAATHAQAEEPDVARASELYEQGQAHHDRGEHLAAARAFADADEIVPDAAALEAALLAVVRVEPPRDAALIGMALVTRAAREPGHSRIGELADQARTRFAGEVGRIVVHCDDCTVKIDGAPARRGVATWVLIGAHEVGIGDERARTVLVEPGAVVTLLPLGPGVPGVPDEARAPPPDSPQPRKKKANPMEPEPDSGPTPAWFWASLALTAAVGVGAVVSAVDTAVKHSDFEEEPTDDRSVEGQGAQTRTNVLLGVTGGLAVLTAVLGFLVVDWTHGNAGAKSLVIEPPGTLTLCF